jgi:hypothetical protein
MTSISNATNVGASDAKLASNCSHVRVGLLEKFFDLFHLLNCQLGVMSRSASWTVIQSSSPSMPHVFSFGNPLKVFYPIVSFNSVFVVNFGQVVRVFDEVKRNKSVSGNTPMLKLTAFTQTINGISVWIDGLLHQLWLFAKLPASQRTRQNLPRGTDLVKTLVPLNILPDFGVHNSRQYSVFA